MLHKVIEVLIQRMDGIKEETVATAFICSFSFCLLHRGTFLWQENGFPCRAEETKGTRGGARREWYPSLLGQRKPNTGCESPWCRQHSLLQFWIPVGLHGALMKFWLTAAGPWLLRGKSTGIPRCFASWWSAVTALLVFHLFLYLKWIKSHETRESQINAPEIQASITKREGLIY